MRTCRMLFFLFMAFIIGMLSCSRSTEVIVQDEVKFSLTIVPDMGTHDVGTIRSLQVVLFRDGAFHSAASGAGSEKGISFLVDKGDYDVYVFVNDKKDWTSDPALIEDEILECISFFSEETPDSFLMFGSERVSVDDVDSISNIPVRSFISSVRLDGISVDLEDELIPDGKPVTLSSVYLINVFGSLGYDLVPSVQPSPFDEWHHRMRIQDGLPHIMEMTADKDISISISDKGQINLALEYFCYPNGCASDSYSEAWSSRRTRLILEILIGDSLYFYHVTLPQMAPNHSYEIIGLTVRSLGGSMPEGQVEQSSLEAVIIMTDLYTGFSRMLETEE